MPSFPHPKDTVVTDASSNLLPPGRGAGAIADRFDGRDRYYVPSETTVAARSVNHRGKHQMVIYNQGDSNSCTANAAATAFWYEELVRGDPSWGASGPSRAFIYWLARGGWQKSKNYDFSPVKDEGSSMRMAMNGIAKCGACPESDCRFPDITKPKSSITQALTTKPSNRPVVEDDSLTPLQRDRLGIDLLQRLKLCLTEGFPVCFSFWFYLNNSEAWNTKSIPYVLVDPWEAPRNIARHTFPEKDGHSVVAVGYDDNKRQVLVQNSWGGAEKDGWGNGLFWMPYSWVTDFYATGDFWTIRITKSVDPSHPRMGWEQINQEILGTA